ncbi:MAG: transcriptional regulator [Neobacillus sp.]|nr:transcriptional regulator [Neobacillus sp.]
MDVIEFGKYLKSKRKLQSLSTHRLSEISGVSQSYISHVESGRKLNVPSPNILEKLADPLGVSYVELMVAAGYWGEEDLLEPINDSIGKKIKKYKLIRSYNHVIREKDLFNTVNSEEISYKGLSITKHDKQLIFAYLDTLFADRLKGDSL